MVGCANTFFEYFPKFFLLFKVRVRWHFFNPSAPHPTRTLKIPKILHRTPHPHVWIGAAVCACAEMLITNFYQIPYQKILQVLENSNNFLLNMIFVPILTPFFCTRPYYIDLKYSNYLSMSSGVTIPP